MKNKISVLVLSLCMLAASMTVTTDNAFAGTVGIDTSAKETLLEEINTVDNSDKCGYEPAVVTLLGHVERPTRSGNKKYSQGRNLYSAPISGASEESSARLGKQYLIDNKEDNCLKAYERIVAGIDVRSDEIVISYDGEDYDVTIDVVEKAFNLVKEDYPEFFWLGNGFGYYDYNKKWDKNEYVSRIEPDYLFYTEEEVKAANQEFAVEVDSILEDVKGKTPYEKELWLHDYLIKTNDYVSYSKHAHTAYGAIIEGEVVCEGYARAFQLLLNKLGIENYTVTGSDQTGVNPQVNHIWNMVNLEGDWYQVDITWDDMGNDDDGIYYSYFNITTDTMTEDHAIVGNEIEIPDCSGTKYNYYNQNPQYVFTVDNNLDREAFASQLASQIGNQGFARIYAVNDNAESLNLWNIYQEISSSVAEKLGVTSWQMGCYYNGNIEYHFYMYDHVVKTSPFYGYLVQGKMNLEDVSIRLYDSSMNDDTIYDEIIKHKKDDNSFKAVASKMVIEPEEDWYLDERPGSYFTRFQFGYIPDGTYNLAVYKDGYGLWIYEIEIGTDGVSLESALENDKCWWVIYNLGDLDDNTWVDASDALFMERYIAGWESYTQTGNWYAADIDNDGEITIKDLYILQRHLAGWKDYEDLQAYENHDKTIEINN